jgi:hypothetical protein
MDDDLDQLATRVFREFARFEYALKAAGFHNGNGPAEPNWRKFAESIPHVFDDSKDETVAAAVRYILDHPPRKQTIVDQVLEWSDAHPTTDLHTERLLVYVRRVRNNLFHGGKFNGRWFAPERSQLLLQHSLTILGACLEASDQVQEAYNN